MTPGAFVAAARARGSDAADVRDAAHEAVHAIVHGLPTWGRREIDRAMMALPPSRRLREEVEARAVEALVCARLGEPYRRDYFMFVAAIEASKTGAHVNMGDFTRAVSAAESCPAVIALADRVIAELTPVAG